MNLEYGEPHRARLAFVRHSRELGFTIDEVRSLLDLSDHPESNCDEANRVATNHLVQVETKIEQLAALRDELTRIVGRCTGGVAADSPGIEALGNHAFCEGAHP